MTYVWYLFLYVANFIAGYIEYTTSALRCVEVMGKARICVVYKVGICEVHMV